MEPTQKEREQSQWRSIGTAGGSDRESTVELFLHSKKKKSSSRKYPAKRAPQGLKKGFKRGRWVIGTDKPPTKELLGTVGKVELVKKKNLAAEPGRSKRPWG